MVDRRQRERALDRIRTICRALSETSERPSHGAPTFFVCGKRAFLMVVANHHGDGRFAIWCPGRQHERIDLCSLGRFRSDGT